MGVDDNTDSPPATRPRRNRQPPPPSPLYSSPAVAEKPTRGRKRKAAEIVDLTLHDEPSELPAPKKGGRRKAKAAVDLELEAAVTEKLLKANKQKSKALEEDGDDISKPKDEEKRLKRFRPKCPTNVIDRMDRARNQRMFVLRRERDESVSPPSESFDLAGSTGNIYTVTISLVPSCDCPDGQKNGTCKHILYVMMKVLKARADLVYQAALLSSELEEIFRPSLTLSASAESCEARSRKPLDEDECPICYESFEGGTNVVYCKAQCGTNMHKACFQQWAASKNGETVTCVMCRTPWQYETQTEDMQGFFTSAKAGKEGYRNIGSQAQEQLGISSRRDESSYNEWWKAKKYGYHGYGSW